MFEKLKNISIVEWCLLEAIVFIAVWLWDPYIGKLITFIFSPIFLAILVISFIADKIDPSKISSKYYLLLLGMGLTPVMVMALYKMLNAYL